MKMKRYVLLGLLNKLIGVIVWPLVIGAVFGFAVWKETESSIWGLWAFCLSFLAFMDMAVIKSELQGISDGIKDIKDKLR